MALSFFKAPAESTAYGTFEFTALQQDGTRAWYTDALTDGTPPEGCTAWQPSGTELPLMRLEYDAALDNGHLPQAHLELLLEGTTAGAQQAALESVIAAAARYDELVCPSLVFTSSLGWRCNGDRRSRDNMAALISLGADKVEYRDADNVPHTLTQQQLALLKREADLNGIALYQRKWQLQAAIAGAGSAAEIAALDISFTMADYTKQA